jgi:hypothetical protein
MSILNAITAGAGGVALSGDTSGNLTIQSAGTNVATFTSSGLVFTNGSALVNSALNDYEQGTWTPTVTSGTGSITSYTADGTYTKIGRMVFMTARVVLTNVGSAGGNMNLTLPYTTASINMQTPIFVREGALTGQTYQFFAQNNSNSGAVQSLSGGAPTWTNSYSYGIAGCFIASF